MATLPWFMILGGFLLIRQVAVGRAKETPDDVHDFAVALLTGNVKDITGIAARRGTNITSTSDTVSGVAGAGMDALGAVQGSALLTEMQRLAAIAQNRYVHGATGPNSYDCSGLVWKAMSNLGIYKGSRFTSNSWPTIAKSTGIAVQVSSPQTGDIADWAQHTPGHIGVMVDAGTLYSALNPTEGITTCPVGEARTNEAPVYWRLT